MLPAAVQARGAGIRTERRRAVPPHQEATMKNNTLAIALAALLVGGVAVAAFQNNRGDAPGAGMFGGGLEYASVVAVDPVTEPREQFAQVLGRAAIHEPSTTSTPTPVTNEA